jgi:sucrose-6-phosphate hydrolase SacC (GH32 family)
MDLPFLLGEERIPCDIKVRAMAYILGRPRYIITNEVVHASVLKFIMKPHSFLVMALTPYPRTLVIRPKLKPPFIFYGKSLDARYENPSILFSNDGIHWTEKTQNPIFPPSKDAVRGGGPHNYDPNLIWNPREEKAYLFFNNWGNGFKNVRLMASKDFINWLDMGQTNIEVVNADEIRASPTVTYNEDEKKYYMLLVHADLNGLEEPFIELFRSDNGLYWVKSGEIEISIDIGGSRLYPWHITLRNIGDEYWLLASMNRGEKPAQLPLYLFFFKSQDLVNWKAHDKPILIPSSKGFDDTAIYHGDLIVEECDLYLYYSGLSRSYSYKIGLVKGKLLKTSCRELRSSNCISEADYEEFRKARIS